MQTKQFNLHTIIIIIVVVALHILCVGVFLIGVARLANFEDKKYLPGRGM